MKSYVNTELGKMWLGLSCGGWSNAGRELGKMADAEILYLAECDRAEVIIYPQSACRRRV